MNTLKKYLGIFWMLAGPASIYFLITSVIHKLNSDDKSNINITLPWIIMICVFLPIAIGLMIFGWYAWKGEYEAHPDLPGGKPTNTQTPKI